MTSFFIVFIKIVVQRKESLWHVIRVFINNVAVTSFLLDDVVSICCLPIQRDMGQTLLEEKSYRDLIFRNFAICSIPRYERREHIETALSQRCSDVVCQLV